MYVRKGKNGTFYLECSAGSDVTGKRQKYYKTVHANGKRDLNREIHKFQQEVNEGLIRKKNQITLAQMCETVLNDVISLTAKETTLQGYRVIIDRIRSFRIGKAKAELVETSDMQKFVKDLSEFEYKPGKTYSAKTIQSTISFISTCYDMGIQASLVTHNPCKGVRVPRKEKSTARALLLDELPVFLMHLDMLEPNIRVAFELALFMGLRRSEICGLRSCHVHEDYLEIKETRHVVNGEQIVSSTKTKGSEACVALPKFLSEDIKELYAFHRKEKARVMSMWQDSDYLILSPYGSPIFPNRMNDSLQRYIKHIGIGHVTFHQLRHTYASLVNHFGADIVELASQMRHSNATTTLSIYTHMVTSVSESSKKYAAKMDEFFSDSFSDSF